MKTGEVAARLQEAGKRIAASKNPAPMPGYGQLFINDTDVGGQGTKVWYVGGDGDEKGFAEVVEREVQAAFPAVSEIIYEAEGFPPKDGEWRQVYPQQKSKALVAVDLHGTIADKSPDHNGEYDPSAYTLQPGAVDALNELRADGHEVAIWTCWATDEAREWLDANGVPYDYVNEEAPDHGSPKIDADVYLDDKAVRHEGDWNRTLAAAYATGKLDKGLCVITNSKSVVDQAVKLYEARKAASEIACPQCAGKGCDFCNDSGTVRVADDKAGGTIMPEGMTRGGIPLDKANRRDLVESQGLLSGEAGYPVSSCPYDKGSDDWKVWMQGYKKGQLRSQNRLSDNDQRYLQNSLQVKKLKGQPTAHGDDEERTRVWVMTTGDTDRDGETVDPEGGDFSEYRLNPTIQWNHDTDKEPIGAMVGMPWNEEVGEGTRYPEVVGPKRMALLGRIKFSKANPFAEQIWQQVQEGTVKGGSISFVPTGRAKQNSGGGNHYPSWRLLEFTLCSVGSNPSAIATAKKCLKDAHGNCVVCHCKHAKSTVLPSAIGGWVLVDGYEVVGRYRTREEAMAAQAKLGKGKVYEEAKGTGSPAFKMGQDSWENDQDRSANPFAEGGHEWEDWNAGYDTADKPVEVSVKAPYLNARCPACGGKGKDRDGRICNTCNGQGKVHDMFKAAKTPHRKENRMLRRRSWLNAKALLSTGAVGKSLWLLKSEGGVDEETKEYLEMRGLDEVRLEDSAPGSDEWVQEEMAEPEHADKAPSGKFRVGETIRPTDPAYEGDSLTIVKFEPDSQGGSYQVRWGNGLKEYINAQSLERMAQGKSGAPSGKTEEVADGVATRSAELIEQGVEELDAVEAAMEEEGVPKAMRPAVKSIVAKQLVQKRRVTVEPDTDRSGNPGFWSVYVDGKPMVGPFKNKPSQSQAEQYAREMIGQGAAFIGGGPSMYRSKQATPEALAAYQQGQKDALKFVEDTDKEPEMEAPLPIETSVKHLRPGDVVRTKAGNLCMVKSIGRKSVTVVKVNGDEKDEEEKNLSVKLKGTGISGPWGEPTKMSGGTWGLATKLTNWYGTLTGATVLKGIVPSLKDADLTGEEQKQVEGEVEEAFMKLAKELGMGEQQYDNQMQDGSGKPSDATTESGLEREGGSGKDGTFAGDNTKSLRLPSAQLKAFVKSRCESKSAKLTPTVASRCWKLFKAINKDVMPEECAAMLCSKAEQMGRCPKCGKGAGDKDWAEVLDQSGTCLYCDADLKGEGLWQKNATQKGLIAAAAKTTREKWQKRFGQCGKASCTKDLLCSKCVKKLTEKIKAKAEEEKTDIDASTTAYPPTLDEQIPDATVESKLAKQKADDMELNGTTDNITGTATSGGTDTLKSLLKRARRKAEGVEEVAAVVEEAKGTADEATGDAAQVQADVHEMSEDEFVEIMHKRFDKIDGKSSELAGTIFRTTCARV